MGIFHVFEIVQIILKRAEYLSIFLRTLQKQAKI